MLKLTLLALALTLEWLFVIVVNARLVDCATDDENDDDETGGGEEEDVGDDDDDVDSNVVEISSDGRCCRHAVAVEPVC